MFIALLGPLQAVEEFYISLVAGSASLADIGLAPAGAAAWQQPNSQNHQEEQQEQEEQGLPSSAAVDRAEEPRMDSDAQQQPQFQRRTFKVGRCERALTIANSAASGNAV
jgi:hypothetical protein